MRCRGCSDLEARKVLDLHSIKNAIRDGIASGMSGHVGTLSVPSVSALSDKQPSLIFNKTNQSQNLLGVFLVTCIILMFLASIFAVANRGLFKDDYANNYVEPKQDMQNYTKVDDRTNRIEKLEEQVSIWKHRSWLLALAVNENANIQTMIDAKHHRCTPHGGYITFGDNWQLNKMPQTMNLTYEQEMKLMNQDRHKNLNQRSFSK